MSAREVGASKGGREFDPSAVAWGGIGGSGRHAAGLLPEVAQVVAREPDRFRRVVEEALVTASDERLGELMDKSKLAWGGIGGSGKHAAELFPEEERG